MICGRSPAAAPTARGTAGGSAGSSPWRVTSSCFGGGGPFTNATGQLDSRVARLTVDAPPAVTANPAPQTINAGGTVTFTAAATGTPAPSVQSQVSKDHGKHFENIRLADTTTLLAHAHFYLGHYAAAEGLYQSALALDRARVGEQHPSYADDLNSLGMLQLYAGHLADAEARFRRALAIREAFYGHDNPETADSLLLVGREAGTVFTRATDHAQRAFLEHRVER